MGGVSGLVMGFAVGVGSCLDADGEMHGPDGTCPLANRGSDALH